MATCRECLHIDICSYKNYQDAVATGKDKEVFITIRNNIACKFFAPKSDYVKRERGEWIKHKSNPKVMDELHKMGIGKAMSRDSIFWTCSCCGTWGTPAHKFCSECGADMRKEDNNDR